ncbi:hypothetical protein HUJ04_006138 [Dendroctonus ponderosae]
MLFAWLLFKLKSFFLVFSNVFRRTLCCFRKRRNSFSETVQLTHVVTSGSEDPPTWSDWGNDQFRDNKPKTVHDYIEQYREQAVKARTGETADGNAEDREDYFEDMTPQIRRQAKVLIGNRNGNGGSHVNSRLSAIQDPLNVATGELLEWDENGGWAGEQLLDEEAQKILREQKRLERERKAWAQHQKRLEKSTRTLGSKLAT